MNVRMVLQRLTPGMQNHGHAELGAEMPGIGRDGGEGLGGCAEQDRIDRGLVVESNLANLAEPQAFARRLGELRRLDWVVYAKAPFGGPEQVLAYLGR